MADSSSDSSNSGLSTEAIIGIAAGGGAVLLIFIVIFLILCCCCYYKKRQQDESRNIGPMVSTRYWDNSHPSDAGPGHVTSGGTLHSRNSWRDSLRSFTRGSLRRSFSLRRSTKRQPQEKQQQPNGLISTPI